ncbi:MAG TPA: nicotinate-nucleotide diphosphorylase (carboxylating), partial [Acidimicrobiales bacterium]|nr:nicotinate-nucleotide diphosphorylase (carboxylating) [Acidimicrobiales bacterium]
MSGYPPADDGLHPPASAVRQAVAGALAEDLLPLGDLSAGLVPAHVRARPQVVARRAGVVAGSRCAAEAFAQVDPDLEVRWACREGEGVEPGQVLAEVEGPLRAILTAERTALNFLGHLSGVATLTRRFVDAATAVDPSVRILDTRKT